MRKLIICGLASCFFSWACFSDSTVVFNEVMYHPSTGGDEVEWIEFHNQMAVDMDLSDWSLKGGIEYSFPNGTVVPGGGYLLVSNKPPALQAATGLTGILGPYSGSLSNAGEEVILYNNSGRIMDRLDYSDASPWPDGPDGTGFTLAKDFPWKGTGDSASWCTSYEEGGTPGTVNFPIGQSTQTTRLLVPVDAQWSYFDSVSAPPLAWSTPAYNGASWPAGNALFHSANPSLVEGNGYPASNPNNGMLNIENPSFEDGALNPPPGYGPVESWPGSGSIGNNETSGAFLNGQVPPEGNRVGFIQGVGQLSQTLTGLIPGQRYSLLFRENERGYAGGERARPSASIGGTVVVQSHDLKRTERFRLALGNPFTASSTTAELVLRNEAAIEMYGDNTALFDQVRVANGVPAIKDPGFETPDITGYVYEPAGSPWSHQGGGFVLSDNNSGFGNPPYEGTQAMVLQGAVRVWQTVNGFEVGKTYVLHWAECDRAGLGGNDIQISIDSNVIAPKHVVNTGWVQRTSLPFVATSTSHQIVIQSFNTAGGDQSTFLDEFYLGQPEGAPPRQTTVQTGLHATYFRKEFSFSGDPARTGLLIDSVYNDAMVLLLNGVELGRFNLPDGNLTHTTTAASSILNASFTGSRVYSGASLLSGTNVLAVAVYQSLETPGDLLFGAEVRLLETSPRPGVPLMPIRFSENSGTSGTPFWLEIENHAGPGINLEGYQLSDNADPPNTWQFPSMEFSQGSLLVVDQNQTGFRPADGAVLVLKNPQGRFVDAMRLEPRAKARCSRWKDRWLYPSAPTPGGENQFLLNDTVVINEIMYHPRPTFATEPVFNEVELLPYDATWKYDQSNTAHGPEWRNPDFVDSGWDAGAGLLYVESASLPGPKNTPLVLGARTYYFRTEFNYNQDPGAVELLLSHIIDDGAVFYLNGNELLRYNMPEAPVEITHNTEAVSAIGNAGLVGPVSVPASFLVNGRNVLAVEVHQRGQGSTDIVFGLRLYTQETEPGIPYQESQQGWVELFNRGSAPVNLAGWKFSKGIRFNFSDGLVLQPGGFLVLAKDPSSLRAEHPGIHVLGPFDGSLSGGGELVTLEDASGNPADEVLYSDEGRWPSYPDGGGHSLELRDPHSDNSQPETWSFSREDDAASWKTYSYRGIAKDQPGTNFPVQWNEFILGLLNDGEVLLDDIRVIEDPSGTRRELIQNGTFSSGAGTWRIIGNHSGAVVPDPDNPSNPVLHLKATGATEHIHNHAETTLAGNTAITRGREYEISYRARWVAGSHQLNSRLYFNLLPKTTYLELPAGTGGTPGATNTVYIQNAGPTYEGLIHEPVVPAEGIPVVVTIKSEDPDGIASLKLWWKRDGADWQQVQMASSDGSTFSASIPGQPQKTVVQFYIEGTDSLGAASFFPAEGPSSRALYTTRDNRTKTPLRHSIRILMLADDATFFHSDTNAMSNERMPCTVVYDEHEVFYNAGARLKGSGFGRIGGRLGFVLYFNPDHLFRGVHGSVSMDRNGGPPTVGASQHEILFKQIVNRAGGIPGMYDDVVDVISPRGTDDSTAQLMMSRYSDLFLDSSYPNGADGTIYEFELIYYSMQTVDGNPESLKRPPNYFNPPTFPVLGVDLQDMGNDKEQYRWNYLIKNQRRRDDYSRLMEMAKCFSLSGGALTEKSKQVLDIDEWMRMFASEVLGGVADTYHNGLQHNIQFYIRPDTNKALSMPWDQDHTFYYDARSSIYGAGSNLSKVINIPANQRLYLGHMHDILNTSFSPSYTSRWIAHYGVMTGLNFNSTLTAYIRDRSNYARSQFPAQVGFKINTNQGQDFSTSTNRVLLEGSGWINIREIRINGRPEPLPLDWPFLTTWRTQLTLSPGMNPLVLSAIDFRGNVVGTQSITITNTTSSDPLVDNLRVSELMYDPATATDDEFIELHNTSSSLSLNLSGVAFTNGITYTFPNNTILQPGEYLVLTRSTDTEGYRLRFGIPAGVKILGGYSGRFANEGEKVTLQSFSGGAVICEFEYSDGRGWPLAAGGPGHSLIPRPEAESAQPYGSLFYGGNWRASAYIKGSPGAADPSPATTILINEIKSNTEYSDPNHPQYASNDWIELYNPNGTAQDLAGWYLSDSADDLKKWRIPAGTIPGYGFLSFDEVNDFHQPLTTGFGLSSSGERLYLSNLPGTSEDRVVDSIDFRGQERETSTGRYPDGSRFDFHLEPSRDSGNLPPDLHPILSEIMYHPLSNSANPGDNTAEEYIEITNPTEYPVQLWNEFDTWRIDGGVTFNFPPGVILGAGRSLVLVGFDPANTGKLNAFCAAYGIQPGPGIFGPLKGTLSNRGERVALEKPVNYSSVDGASWSVIDEVFYFDQSPWTSAGDGTGLSLQRSAPAGSGNDPASWTADYPSPQADAPLSETPTPTMTSLYSPTPTLTRTPSPTATRTVPPPATPTPTATEQSSSIFQWQHYGG